MKIRRIIASTPQRSAKATWSRIVTLITKTNSRDADQLEAARSVMEAIIAEECPANSPIIVSGSGPRLVIYLRYDADAIELGDDIESLTWNPTEGDWNISAPAFAEDVSWMNSALGSSAVRISIRNIDDDIGDEQAKSEASNLAINWGVLGS